MSALVPALSQAKSKFCMHVPKSQPDISCIDALAGVACLSGLLNLVPLLYEHMPGMHSGRYRNLIAIGTNEL